MFYKQEMIKKIRQLGQQYGTYDVFFHFVELTSLAIANTAEENKAVFDQREKRYADIRGKYSEKEFEIFPQLLAMLESELKTYPSDILGEIFHDLELHNKWRGQFFTPMPICEFMSEITLCDLDGLLKERGYISVDEPACGSGAMLIGMARVLTKSLFKIFSTKAKQKQISPY